MELRELRSFCTAARLRSMSKAADYLQVGQPTVTTHIRKLEDELGMVLFDRVKRPIQLTLAGSSLAQLATPLVEGIDALARDTTLVEEEGPVSVVASHDIVSHTLLRIVGAFRMAYPHVRLRIHSGTRDEVIDHVIKGEADIGIVPGHDRSGDVDFEGLFSCERVLITPKNHPLLDTPIRSLDQIAVWPLILMGGRTYTRGMLEGEFRRRGLSYEVVVELDNMDEIKRYVALGMGVSVGLRLAIEPEDEEQLGIRSLAALLPVEQAGMITLRGKVLSTPRSEFHCRDEENPGHQLMRFSWPAHSRSLRMNFCTLPVAVLGSSPKATDLGHLKCASLSRQKSITSCSVASVPDRGATNALGTSPQ